MKTIFTTVILTLMLFSTGLTAQTTHPWELGFNGGAAWQKSDVKMKKLGGGLGFTLGQMYCQTETSPLDWGWRFRYLNANTYGQDSKRSTGLMYNSVLNGTVDTTLNYNSNGGFVYQNYKTKIDELSIELLIGANRLRERTKVYPYIFGGVGIVKAVAKTDQLNANGIRYNYSLIDSSGTSSSSEINTQLNNIRDNNYESAADGNLSPGWKFMPSLGVGLGFQLTKGFSIGLEHKMTWALNDVIDGQQWSNTNAATGNNDKYHYSSFWLKFSFGRTAKPTSTTNTDVTNYTNNNTVVTPTPEKPNINLTNPGSGSATVSQQTYTIKAKITNINSTSDILFSGNGNTITNFTYNAGSQVFSAPVMLISGSNNFVITATNTVGSSTANASIVYSMPPPPAALAPVVSITNPNVNPYTTNDAVIGVGGTVANINDRNQMQVMVNGTPTSSFTYSPATKVFMVNAALTLGANTFVISATNPSGIDSKSTTVIYQQDASAFVGPPPVVTISTPAANPYNTAINIASVTGSVMNVTASSQITVSLNGSNVPFTFNAGTHQLAFNASLIIGANSITISASNANGNDSKSRTIIYTPVVNPKPVVTITNPGVNPYTSSFATVPVNATVLNVTALGQISVSINGSILPTATLAFNSATAQLSFNANLIAGANNIQVTASNVSGSDSKSTTIIYSQVVAAPAPVVTITNPSTNPYNTNSNSITVNATVLNVTTSSQISASVNGSSVPFSFNAGTHQLSLNASLVVGANIVAISATNTSGTDSRSASIIYTVPVTLPGPVVVITNPSSNPFTTSVGTTTINATVMNVSAASQITVKLNGSNVPFNFNAATHLLDLNASLILGANTVSVSASNPVGSDSKSTTIIYTPAAPAPAPVVTITSPNINPYLTDQPGYNVKATVLNVTGSSQIQVLLNGTASTAFTYSAATKQLVFIPAMHLGSNTIKITATNATGSDSKTILIKVVPSGNPGTGTGTDSVNNSKPGISPVKGIPSTGGGLPTVGGTSSTAGSGPAITLVTPSSSAVTTTDAVYTIAATVDVSHQTYIKVKVNGTLITTWSFNRSTKALSIPLTLSPGSTTVLIEATAAALTNSKTITITKP